MIADQIFEADNAGVNLPFRLGHRPAFHPTASMHHIRRINKRRVPRHA
jgi:hypothetical protein